jgi:hypothetical protein
VTLRLALILPPPLTGHWSGREGALGRIGDQVPRFAQQREMTMDGLPGHDTRLQ